LIAKSCADLNNGSVMSSVPLSQRSVRFSQGAETAEKMTATESPDLSRKESSGSASSVDSDAVANKQTSSGDDDNDDDNEGIFHFTPAVVTTPLDEVPSLTNSGQYGWSSQGQARGRVGSSSTNGGMESTTSPTTNGANKGRPVRPSAVRTPSNAYAPATARRPTQHSLNTVSSRHRNSSRSRRNPNADYRAQEKAYVQRIRQDAPDPDDFFDADMRTPSLDLSTDSNSDEESPTTADYIDDPYDNDSILYFGNDDISVEELKVPENRERLEWHSMLASVLTGDVVKQEKKRLTGSADQHADGALRAELWLGIRAKCCGRLLQAQRRMVEEGRAKVKSDVEGIITFEIKGEAEVGLTPAEQVQDVVNKIEKCECLYPTREAMEAAHPRAASQAFHEACDAVIAWHNTTQLINTELQILRNWVGNDELDFTKLRRRDENHHGEDGHLSDESSFIDRILKEDGLKSLQGKDSLLVGLVTVINKAKMTMIANAQGFADRHLPPYIEELQTLINFPSRLVQEIIRVRLSYAKKMKDPAQQGVMMTEQMIGQFQILLNLAVRIREAYNAISQQENGWDPPECIEEGFDMVVLDALKFYFKLLNWKLSANKNAFKEAEILEQEWDFSNKLGRYLEGGDVEVAEQFW
jgi:mitogen-activated protein kinase kinase kinase